MSCPPCNRNCAQGRACSARNYRHPVSITAWWWLILAGLACFWAAVIVWARGGL